MECATAGRFHAVWKLKCSTVQVLYILFYFCFANIIMITTKKLGGGGGGGKLQLGGGGGFPPPLYQSLVDEMDSSSQLARINMP